jgi:hypothetical protein
MPKDPAVVVMVSLTTVADAQLIREGILGVMKLPAIGPDPAGAGSGNLVLAPGKDGGVAFMVPFPMADIMASAPGLRMSPAG